MSNNELVIVIVEAVLQPSLGEDHPYLHKMNFQIRIHLRRYRSAIEMVLSIARVKLTGIRWHFTMATNTIEVLFHKFSALYWVILFQRQLRPYLFFLFKYLCSYSNVKSTCSTNNRQNKHSIENRIVK